mgnify:CR=1 FL=1
MPHLLFKKILMRNREFILFGLKILFVTHSIAENDQYIALSVDNNETLKKRQQKYMLCCSP